MKSCFVICPIGDEGSPIRRQSDCVFEYIIKPSLKGFDYEPIRVDKADKPSHITTEIIQHLLNDDLVIADLSTLNANVFYELGIRHAYAKPCILLSDWVQKPPFDVSGINTIRYIHDDPKSHAMAIARVREQITVFEQTTTVSNPVTVALGYARLAATGDTTEQLILSLAEKVESLESELREIKSKQTRRIIAEQLVATEMQRSYGTNALRAFAPVASEPPSDADSLADVLTRHLGAKGG